MMMMMLNITLAVFNLLPIPVLDGGHILQCLIELAIRRPLPEMAVGIAQRIGLAALITLMLVATTNDVFRHILG
jgi:regulator of sigma E protease